MLHRAARRTGLFLLALFLVACSWELYKALGPEEGGTFVIPFAKTNDRAMPHIDVEGASVIEELEVPVPDDASELDDDRELVGV